MFEEISEAPQREGIRGLIRRHFGSPADLDDARQEITRVATIFSAIGLVGAVLGAMAFGIAGMLDGAVIAVAALILRFTQSRIAAGILLVFTLLILLIQPSFWHVIWLLFAIRGFQLAILANRLKRKERADSPPDAALMPGESPDNPYRRTP